MLSFIFATFATRYTFLLNNRVYCAGGFQTVSSRTKHITTEQRFDVIANDAHVIIGVWHVSPFMTDMVAPGITRECQYQCIRKSKTKL